MSEVKRYTPSMKVGHMVKDCDGLWIRSQDFDAAQSELAALREELAGLQSSCGIDRRHLDRMIDHGLSLIHI